MTPIRKDWEFGGRHGGGRGSECHLTRVWCIAVLLLDGRTFRGWTSSSSLGCLGIQECGPAATCLQTVRLGNHDDCCDGTAAA